MKFHISFSRFVIGVLSLLSVCASAQRIDYKGFPQWSWHKQDSTEYYLYTPANMEKGKRYPVALFLHGCCGQSYHATLRNAVDPPVRMWHNFGENKQSIPTYIIAPATSRGWKQHIPNLKKVIDDLIAGNADPTRIYITGFSMGSNGTWQFLDAYPDLFAAAIPMGSGFFGMPEKIKDVPVWAIMGETDWHARTLPASVLEIRKANGTALDSAYTWATGVNPLLTIFKNMGHVVQWEAASTLPLLQWAYSKINDGNHYPVVEFVKPSLPREAKEGETIMCEIKATDSGGAIDRVEVFANGAHEVLCKAPYVARIKCGPWGADIKAVAYDDKQKSTSTSISVYTSRPPEIIEKMLPPATVGKYYQMQFTARGNGTLTFSGSLLPPGFSISSSGLMQGMPVESGTFRISVKAQDAHDHSVVKDFQLSIRAGASDAIVVTNASTYDGTPLEIGIVQKNVSPYLGSDTEATFSGEIPYAGMTLVKTPKYDSATVSPAYLKFTISNDAQVYIAYEKLTGDDASTLPAWLSSFRKLDGQLTTQYFYYDVFTKAFPKGEVVLPDAEEQLHHVDKNYFVFVGPPLKK